MFDHLLESSQWDDSSKRSNIEFGQEIDILKMKIRTLSAALISPYAIYRDYYIIFYISINIKYSFGKTKLEI